MSSGDGPRKRSSGERLDNLLEMVNRTPVPEPWAEGEKIPWDDPGFSERMLQEHLSDQHDAASRRPAIIDAHVDWIHRDVLNGRPSRVLDLGCGPGLYTSRLARLGHECVGIDFGPASIRYAQETAEDEGLNCRYIEGDIRTVDFGEGFDLVMLIFGEFNVFPPADARSILNKARTALNDEGQLLLEAHTFRAVQLIGSQPANWATSTSGLFSDRPHIRLEESFWDRDRRTATERYFVVDAQTADVTRYAASMQAYSDAEYRTMLERAGFQLHSRCGSLEGEREVEDFVVLVATAI